MSKHGKAKKDKVPKITEAEYAAYVSSLTQGNEQPVNADVGTAQREKPTSS